MQLKNWKHKWMKFLAVSQKLIHRYTTGQNVHSIRNYDRGKANERVYKDFNKTFYGLPLNIRSHRSFFSREQRGFGESAFHAMWYLLFQEFCPKKCMEIGVYRGQVISLWAVISNDLHNDVDIIGVSPFDNSADEVSEYLAEVNYYDDVCKNLKQFNAYDQVTLHKALSNSESVRKMAQDSDFDLIYIDGSHDYEDVLNDVELAHLALKSGGLMVLDDSSLYLKYNPPLYAFAGHPGPSLAVINMDKEKFEHLITVGHNNVFLKK